MPQTTIPTANHSKAEPRSLFARLFTHHPMSVGESYFVHMRFALGFSFWLFVASLAALAHALVPAAFETTAGRIVRRLAARIEARH